MRFIVTGSGRAASWEVRGRQLGRAAGAAIQEDAPLEVLRSVDAVVVVKRVGDQLARNLRACGRPVLWDALDFYRQTDPSDRAGLVRAARAEAERVGATHVIGATRQMAEDLESPHYLRHHGWERGVAKIRERISRVVYEGAEDYLGQARQWIAGECSHRGISFVVNPQSYLDADIVLAYRDGPYDTYATRNWKSGIKLANAQVAGIPFVAQSSMGYLEQSTGAEMWFEDAESLGSALDALESRASRLRAAGLGLEAAARLPVVAAELRQIVESVL